MNIFAETTKSDMIDEHLYIQKTKENSTVKCTVDDFDIYCMDIQFSPIQEVKELPNNDWFDEHGDDEYIPEALCVKAYTWDIKFACKGAFKTVNEKINAFVAYLTGADGSGAEMKMYSSYTQIGRQGVRFMKMDDSAELIRDKNGDILMFNVTFKVNDPVTNIVLTKS